MSCNCTRFIIKKIKDLRIPVASLYKSERSDWHFERINYNDGSVAFENGETAMAGRIKDDIFICKLIDCVGEGSGFIMSEILEPAFKDSSGILIASCVWEGGDEINKLIVKDGDVRWKDIKI